MSVNAREKTMRPKPEKEMTWTCHVCKKVRPDKKISVFTRTHIFPGGVEMKENIRYCKDKDKCRKGAKNIHHVREAKP